MRAGAPEGGGVGPWGGEDEGYTAQLGALSLWSICGRSTRKFVSAYIPGAGGRSGPRSSRGLYDDPPCFYPEGGFSADYRRRDTGPKLQLRLVDRAGKIGSFVGRH